MNKFFNLTLRQWLIAFLSFAILAPSLEAIPPRCEKIEINRNSPYLAVKFNSRDVKRDIETTKKKKRITTTKAKGIVGEKYARDEIEARYKGKVSLFTYFESKGCNINQHIRGKGDQGLDDIFVTLNARGQINREIPPIFHEAKYNGQCNLQLNTTKTMCQQLSIKWIERNLEKSSTVKFCFPNDPDVEVEACSKCNTMFLKEIEWIRTQFEEKNFDRTASVLCANGNLKFYKVPSKK